MEDGELIVVPPQSGQLAANAVIEAMTAMRSIREFVAKELVRDTDYGIIPGTTKPTLYLPGAQKIGMLFNCYPEYEVKSSELAGGHVEHIVTCRLVSRASREPIGCGVGSCTTLEKKYRWRQSSRLCPVCGKDTIIKGKEEYGGGWLCWPKKGGCNAKFPDSDTKITSQEVGRVENDDIADARNTVLKIAKKRAQVDAALGLGCVAEMFTQDIGDDQPPPSEPEPVKAPAKAKEKKPEGNLRDKSLPVLEKAAQEGAEQLRLSVEMLSEAAIGQCKAEFRRLALPILEGAVPQGLSALKRVWGLFASVDKKKTAWLQHACKDDMPMLKKRAEEEDAKYPRETV